MALVLGGAFVGALIVYDNSGGYGDHSDYSDYSNYSDYSDAEERRRRRIASMKSDTEGAVNRLASYKRTTVNPKLSSQQLRNESAMRVSVEAMDKDVTDDIRETADYEIERETQGLIQELDQIELLLQKIAQIEEENETWQHKIR